MREKGLWHLTPDTRRKSFVNRDCRPKTLEKHNLAKSVEFRLKSEQISRDLRVKLRLKLGKALENPLKNNFYS